MSDESVSVWSVYLLPLLVTPLISPGQLFLEELQDEEEGSTQIRAGKQHLVERKSQLLSSFPLPLSIPLHVLLESPQEGRCKL